ncbi:MAG: hypothetical protein A2Y15_04370 [Clostridiales bacterium GWF2_36_10]|nr:MAG: hypothetical protein A2Y15_04370 [Clostridiales bacterium GWF2_36_10]HAN20487.1 hypothetical protein [Clostridiales bacterium]
MIIDNATPIAQGHLPNNTRITALAQGKKKSRKISAELKHISDALTATGKGGQFATICAVSLTLLFCGGMFATANDISHPLFGFYGI